MGMKKNTGQSGPKKLFLRFSQARDLEKLIEFYTMAKPGVQADDLSDLAEKIRNGSAVMLVDDNGGVQAAALVSPVVDSNGQHVWTLVSDVHSHIPHFDLARVLVAAGTVQNFFTNPPEFRFVAQAPADNELLMAFVQKQVGWTDLTPGDNCTAVLAAMRGARNSKWFECGPQQIIRAARAVQDVVENDYCFTNGKTGQKYQIDVSQCPLATSYRWHVDTLAGCYDSPDEKPDPKFGLGQMSRSFRLGIG